jgi:hypothetical protein
MKRQILQYRQNRLSNSWWVGKGMRHSFPVKQILNGFEETDSPHRYGGGWCFAEIITSLRIRILLLLSSFHALTKGLW